MMPTPLHLNLNRILQNKKSEMPLSLKFSNFSLILKNDKILPIQFHCMVPKSIFASFTALIPNANIQCLICEIVSTIKDSFVLSS
jgi:hypothetical protein